jgi:hypothetical protein
MRLQQVGAPSLYSHFSNSPSLPLSQNGEPQGRTIKKRQSSQAQSYGPFPMAFWRVRTMLTGISHVDTGWISAFTAHSLVVTTLPRHGACVRAARYSIDVKPCTLLMRPRGPDPVRRTLP